MKSKCCDVDVVVFTSKERTSYYVCRECKEACDLQSRMVDLETSMPGVTQLVNEHFHELLDTCEPVTEPKFVGRWQGEDGKDSLEMALTAQVSRLTPEQWARVRWPSEDDIDLVFGDMTLYSFARWAITYALQDLKPEEEAIEDLDKLLEGEE